MTLAREFQLRLAVHSLRRGGVVAHACEGVWGLACDPFDAEAVARVLRIKNRPMAKGLIVIGADSEVFAEELRRLDAERVALIKDSWPGPETWIVPHKRFPAWVSGGRDTVAVRVPGHRQARRLLQLYGAPLVSTSANRSGRAAPKTMLQTLRGVGREVDIVLPGKTCGRAGPSRIRDAVTARVVR